MFTKLISSFPKSQHEKWGIKIAGTQRLCRSCHGLKLVSFLPYKMYLVPLESFCNKIILNSYHRGIGEERKENFVNLRLRNLAPGSKVCGFWAMFHFRGWKSHQKAFTLSDFGCLTRVFAIFRAEFVIFSKFQLFSPSVLVFSVIWNLSTFWWSFCSGSTQLIFNSITIATHI